MLFREPERVERALRDINATLALLCTSILLLNQKAFDMSEQLDRLQASVTKQAAVIDSAVSLLADLAQQIRDTTSDGPALATLADQVDAKTNALQSAVGTFTTT